MNRIKFITEKIHEARSAELPKKYIDEAKNYFIRYYKRNENKLNKLEFEKIEEFNFFIQVIKHAENLHKSAQLERSAVKLERHKYAPELNTIHFSNGATATVSKATTITQAVKQVASENKYIDKYLKKSIII